jgi:NTE family protein
MKHKVNKISRDQIDISLALQGGGAHGAISWGVLERILEQDNINIQAISATSSGAMIAAIVVSALSQENGRNEAIKNLDKFWHEISNMSNISPLQPNFFEKMVNLGTMAVAPMFQASDWFKHIFAPYQFNFFDVYPFNNILNDFIDYSVIKKSNIKLLINASNVKSGEAKIFSNRDLSDSKRLIASACSPYLIQSIKIGDESYWDGCFSGNPMLSPLIDFTETEDIIVIRVLPIMSDDMPRTIPDIIDRADEISTNRILLNEVKMIQVINNLILNKKLKTDKYRVVRMHNVATDDIISAHSRSSKMNAELDFLLYLKAIGRQAADDWIKRNLEKVGYESTWKL